MNLNQILDNISTTSELDRLFINGLNPNTIVNVHNNDRIIHKLSDNSNPDFLKILFKYRVDPNALNDSHQTALMTALNNDSFEPLETVQFLLQHGTDPNIIDNQGNNALHKATYFGYDNIVLLLLNYGMDTNVKNNIGQTAIDIAVNEHQYSIEDILINYFDPIKEPDRD